MNMYIIYWYVSNLQPASIPREELMNCSLARRREFLPVLHVDMESRRSA